MVGSRPFCYVCLFRFVSIPRVYFIFWDCIVSILCASRFLPSPLLFSRVPAIFSCHSLWSYSIQRTPFARADCLVDAPAGAFVRVTSSRREKENMERGTQVGLSNWLQRRRQWDLVLRNFTWSRGISAMLHPLQLLWSIVLPGQTI